MLIERYQRLDELIKRTNDVKNQQNTKSMTTINENAAAYMSAGRNKSKITEEKVSAMPSQEDKVSNKSSKNPRPSNTASKNLILGIN